MGASCEKCLGGRERTLLFDELHHHQCGYAASVVPPQVQSHQYAYETRVSTPPAPPAVQPPLALANDAAWPDHTQDGESLEKVGFSSNLRLLASQTSPHNVRANDVTSSWGVRYAASRRSLRTHGGVVRARDGLREMAQTSWVHAARARKHRQREARADDYGPAVSVEDSASSTAASTPVRRADPCSAPGPSLAEELRKVATAKSSQRQTWPGTPRPSG